MAGGALVALLDMDRSEVGALLDAHLRRRKLVNWWPRELTARLLNEIEPSPLFELPAGPATPGPALLPDALIFLRIQTSTESRIARIVACDPVLGLRLGAGEVPLTRDIGKDLEQMTTVTIGLLKKLGQPLTALWAVPPLRCQDLVRKHDFLRHSLAGQFERVLLARKGVFTVELEYAQALMLARHIAGKRAPIERPLPRIVLGQFRTESVEGQERVSLTISVRHSETISPALKTGAAPLDELDSIIEKAVGELAGQVVDGGSQRHDGAAGGQAFAQVIADYEKAGDDDSILSLAEAGLLVNPADARFQKHAISMVARLSRRHEEVLRRLAPPGRLDLPRTPEQRATPPDAAAEMLRFLNTQKRALSHCRSVLESAKEAGSDTDALTAAASELLGVLAFKLYRELPPEIDRRCEDLRRRRQQLSLEFLERAAARGNPGHMYVLSELPAAERHALVLRMIVQWRDYPRPEVRVPRYASEVLSYSGTSPEEAESFLTQLAALPDPLAQSAAATIRAQRVKAAASSAASRPAPIETPGTAEPDAEVICKPLPLPFLAATLNNQEVVGACELCLPLGDRFDLFAKNKQIAISKERGKVRLIWEAQRAGWNFEVTPGGGASSPALACYDGRFAWVPASQYGKPPRLLVVDPETETVVEFDASDGLPYEDLSGVSRAFVGAAPLSPGKVLLAGSFGKSWLGIATFDPEKGKSLKIIHEARDQPVREDRLQARTTTVAFHPTILFTLSGKDEEGKPMQRVVVGRFSERNPLVVDPEKETVEVLEAPLDFASSFLVHDGALYWTAPDPRKWTLGAHVIDVWKLALPDLKKELVGQHDFGKRDSRRFSLALEDDRTFFVADHWYVADSREESPRALRGNLPGAKYHRRQPIRTNHHGWVLHGGYPVTQVYTVEFKDEAIRR